jgi:hypothetical protein
MPTGRQTSRRGRRPHDELRHRAMKRRYSTTNPVPDDHGAVTELALWAGQGVDAIRDIPSAGELVGRLWRECLDA